MESTISHHLQTLINSHADILLPAFRTCSLLLGLLLLSAGLSALFRPVPFAKTFGCPLPPESPSRRKDERGTKEISTSIFSSSSSNSSTKGWMFAMASRELALGSSILLLLYLGELKALSVILMCGNFVGVGDTVGGILYGTEGSYLSHLIPSLLFVWVGPVGYLLHSKV